ncbi:2-polyprenyl-6-methoxyphenol hydroxylase-like FAD-dependent oxidoreductase [Actinomycetospora cinnamomea]|uniref:2-polyprenyl-6-methoxyphenol hydroxylase-like FAD-dependent oxidoreductase n=1 Tax=Actinomycetospora cinnamomea TaxID=663609 RepID=A0A2U1FAA9_9PSEU|nr:2-polyprenyl-6-methoxyphenol hydroxylase-like FAD-dependent oxidoreductase [Actinomycetospora cinnamomea]
MKRAVWPSREPGSWPDAGRNGARPDPQPVEDPVEVDVLVVGAGPTGLTAAGEAVRHGLTVRIVDRKPQRATFSKALVVHARTLEVFEAMGVAEAVLAEGRPFAALNVHAGRGRRATRIDLLGLPWGDTAYPFWLSIPQYATEGVLEGRLDRLGVAVDWGVALDRLDDRRSHVESRLEHADGTIELVRSRWVIGCDGGRSRTREQAGLRLERTAAGVTFLLADVTTTALPAQDEGHVFLGPDGLLVIVPMPEPGRWRVIAQEPRADAHPPHSIDTAHVDEVVRSRAGLDLRCHDLLWGSRFELSHGVVDRYRRGRVFLAGDAAHVHSPVGGQGLNTGVQDAHNLLWQLALARRVPARGREELLDSYEEERRPVAAAMVAGTGRATRLLTMRNRAFRRLLGVLAPLVITHPAIRTKFGRTVGMLEVGYRSGRSLGGGRRMPNPELRGGGRLYERLDPVRPTWVVRHSPGETPPAPQAAGWRGLPLLELPEEDLPDESLSRVTLVRPDRYVALRGETAEEAWALMAHLPFAR